MAEGANSKKHYQRLLDLMDSEVETAMDLMLEGAGIQEKVTVAAMGAQLSRTFVSVHRNLHLGHQGLVFAIADTARGKARTPDYLAVYGQVFAALVATASLRIMLEEATGQTLPELEIFRDRLPEILEALREWDGREKAAANDD